MKFRIKSQRARGMEVDITPMVDIVFLLIVFFLTTAAFARLTRADVDLPVEQGEGLRAFDEPGIIVNVLADGAVVIDDEAITLARLESIIRREVELQPGRDASRVKLLLRADRNLSAARLNEVVRVIQEAGVGLGRFGTEVPR